MKLQSTQLAKKKYNNEKLILATLRRESETRALSPKPTSLSTVSLSFDFNNKCFFCEDSVTEEYRKRQNKLPVERRNPMVKVTLPEVAITILSYARQRGDEWGKKNRRSCWHFRGYDVTVKNEQLLC